MKIVQRVYFVQKGPFVEAEEFKTIIKEVEAAILSVTWNSDKEFIINPTKKGNGVNPIKNNFVSHLKLMGWETEKRMSIVNGLKPGPIDAIKRTAHGIFAVEWETGNISSSHRALNKIATGIIQRQVIGGILVLPVKNLSKYLTDRVGNYEELSPYFPMYQHFAMEGLIGVIAVDADSISLDVPLIEKGKDGNAKKE